MTAEDFTYWLRGVLMSPFTGDEMGKLVLKKASEILDRKPTLAAVAPAMHQIRVPAFCIHNVAVIEDCAACNVGVGDGRIFGFKLPPGTAAVYIPKPTKEVSNA